MTQNELPYNRADDVGPMVNPADCQSLPWMDYTSIITIIAVTLLTFGSYTADDTRRWFALGAIALFVLLYQPLRLRRPKAMWFQVGRVVALTFLVSLLFLLGAQPFSGIVLFFTLSVTVMELFSSRTALLWIILFGLITIGAMLALVPSPLIALSLGGGAMGGYFFMGAATNAQRQAEKAKTESQRLLRELQEAHRQLQEHSAQAEELAASQERNRLAREVHDTLGHRLTVAAVQLEGVEKLIDRNPQKARSMVSTVREQVLDGLGELRNTVAALRTPLDEEISLPNALRKLATDFEEATAISTTLLVTGDLPPLPDSHRHAFYRAAQESLTNIQRHAGAQHAWVQLQRQNGSLLLSISDDGIGIDNQDQQNGFGLHGIEERALQIEGTVTISPRSGGGTEVHIQVPVR